MVKMISAIILLALAGCASPKGSFCLVATPMRPSAAALAAMSDQEVDTMLAHNEKGQRLCDWTPAASSK